METHQVVCDWDGDTLDVYISTQYVWGVRDDVAEELELPADKVRVVCEYMGGGFGAKNEPGDYTFVAAELAKRTGRPVKCALTRREENVAAGNRNATIQRLTSARAADGTLVALGGEFVNAVGWAGWSAIDRRPDADALRLRQPAHDDRYGAKLNTPPMKAFRAPGFVEGTFGLECLLDELAAKLDLDPLELRRKNYADVDDGDAVLLEEPDGVLRRRAEAHWERRARGARALDATRGSAASAWRRRSGTAAAARRRYAWIRLGSDGRARRRHRDAGRRHRHEDGDGADRGRGARLPARARRVSLGDTARGPYASISAGSSTTPSMGPAVRAAAADAKRQMIEIAAQRYDREERVLDIEDGNVVSADGSLAARRRRSGCSRTRRSSARARAARTRPG